MELQIHSYKAEEIVLNYLNPLSPDIKGNKNFNLEFEVIFNPTLPNFFAVVFLLGILHEGEFSLKIKYTTWFTTSENIEESFTQSQFAQINAPAIAFPFLRALVSTITINAGYNPSVLPSVNFVQIYENNASK